jgi:hypothetical protein
MYGSRFSLHWGTQALSLTASHPLLPVCRCATQIISDLAHEELLQSHCDSFRVALDLVTRVALEIHTDPQLANHQRALVALGVAGRASRPALESYLTPRSPVFASDPAAFMSVLLCNCLTGQATDVIHWLYNIVLGFDWDWGRGEASILTELGL